MAAPSSWRMQSCRWSDSIASRPRLSSGGNNQRRSITAGDGRLPAALPLLARCHPDIREMAEQVEFALLFRPKTPCHRLGRGVLAVDAVDDLVELEGRERPVDRRPPRLQPIALSPKLFPDAPADFKTP